MKYRLLNYIICPKCREFPLKLTVLNKMEYDRSAELPRCDLYCGYLEKYLKEIEDTPCKECIKYEVVDGYLKCPKCGDTYPIINSITILQLKFLKPKRVIKEFIEKYRGSIPEDVYKGWLQ